MADKEPQALKDFRETIVTAAADAVVSQMTPLQLRACAQGMLDKLISDIVSSSEYSDLGRMIKAKAQEAMREHLETENVKGQIRGAVIQGVNDALAGMREEVKGKVIDVSLKAMTDALANTQRRR